MSVDLDEIPNYYRIHGLPVPDGCANAVYDVALARLDGFAAAHAFPLTLFAVGADVARPESAERLRAACESGHELANHSLDHRYDLTRLGRDEIRRQVSAGAEKLAAATGRMPVGFRAPGYTTTDEVYEVLTELGVEYSSSVFPCPAYYSAKAVAIGAIGLRRRVSHSIVDTPRVLTAPADPYRVGKPYWTGGSGVWEMPIAVTRRLRLPFIGTALTLAGPSRARWLARGMLGRPFVNLELHGIDMLDSRDGLAALAPYQADVRVSLERKREALAAAIDVLRRAGYAFVRLDEAARAFASRA